MPRRFGAIGSGRYGGRVTARGGWKWEGGTRKEEEVYPDLGYERSKNPDMSRKRSRIGMRGRLTGDWMVRLRRSSMRRTAYESLETLPYPREANGQ